MTNAAENTLAYFFAESKLDKYVETAIFMTNAAEALLLIFYRKIIR
jgi:hypothetical protein